MITIDRIKIAELLASGARVLDIGGQKMEGCDPNSPFAIRYSAIEHAASEYRIVDYQNEPTVDYVVNFNESSSISSIRKIIDDYKPQVILCMEMLEHVNYHFELMNEMAQCVAKYDGVVFITVPNNGNWVFNALGWNNDHSIAFLRDIAYRFITRSDLGKHSILVAPCMQKYLWYWRVAYVLSMLQPFSWGFLVSSKNYKPNNEIEHIVKSLRVFTNTHF